MVGGVGKKEDVVFLRGVDTLYSWFTDAHYVVNSSNTYALFKSHSLRYPSKAIQKGRLKLFSWENPDIINFKMT